MDRDQLAEHLRFAAELGVEGVSRDPAWRRKGETHDASRQVGAEKTPVPFFRNLAAVRADIGDCTRCKLSRLGRSQIVFGVGNPDADLMFVGEAPGADEDKQGEPFVGRAGQLLTKIIKAMGFARGEVYIANILKCRPDTPGSSYGNRPPTPTEMQTCRPYLTEQIDIIQPKMIVALGATAVEGLLGTRAPMHGL